MSSLQDILADVRSFSGIRRKRSIAHAVQGLGQKFYDDGAVIGASSCGSKRSGDYILVADSIMPSLVKSDPHQAGWSAMLVNANDCVAMGSMPAWAVDIISGDESTIARIGKGLADASERFNIRIVGGHTNPGCEPAVNVAIVGIRGIGGVLRSCDARQNDVLVMAIDLDGKQSGMYEYGWDAVTMKSGESVQQKWKGIVGLNDFGQLHACKDISMPGILGTIVSMCEASGVGAVVNVERIPKPEQESLSKWLCMYQSMGFIFAMPHVACDICISILESRGFTVATCGTFTNGKEVIIRYDDEKECFWDVSKHSLYGYDDEGRKERGVHP